MDCNDNDRANIKFLSLTLASMPSLFLIPRYIKLMEEDKFDVDAVNEGHDASQPYSTWGGDQIDPPN